MTPKTLEAGPPPYTAAVPASNDPTNAAPAGGGDVEARLALLQQQVSTLQSERDAIVARFAERRERLKRFFRFMLITFVTWFFIAPMIGGFRGCCGARGEAPSVPCYLWRGPEG